MVSRIKYWSTIPAENNDKPPYGAPENWRPSDVNKVQRQVMADIRLQCEDMEWFNWGHEATYADDDTFTISGDVTGIYTADRPIKIIDTETLYGYIKSSSYVAPNTTIKVVLRSGKLTSAMTGDNVYLSILTPSGYSIPIRTVDAVPVGAIFAWPSDHPVSPKGYLFCWGGEVSRTDYWELFNVIGESFGKGNGETTFNLPDFRGVFLRGLDKGRGLDSDGPRWMGHYQEDALQQHTHNHNAAFNRTFPTDPTWVSATNYLRSFPIVSSGVNGARTATETRTKNIAINYIIKHRISTV